MTVKETTAIMAELDAIVGVSGFEKPVGDRMAAHLQECVDEMQEDTLGNRVFIKHGKNPNLKIMLSAHMDEIGFMVHDIHDDGFLAIIPVGMHDPRMLVNQVLIVRTGKGDLPGVVGGGPPIHTNKDTSAAFTFADVKMDIGATSRRQAEEMGVCVGDMVFNRRDSRMLGEHIFSGNAVDNRSGCAAMIQTMRMLKDVETEATIYACGTVQEEVGIRGAQVLAPQLNPNYALAMDVCYDIMTDKVTPSNSRVFQGKGPAIQFYDWNPVTFLGNIVPRCITDRLIHLAGQANIPYQRQVMLCGGTDAASISLSSGGVLSGCLLIPNRYIHSAIGSVHVEDVHNTALLAAAFAKDITR